MKDRPFFAREVKVCLGSAEFLHFAVNILYIHVQVT